MFKALLESQITVKRLLMRLFGKRRRRKSSGLESPVADGRTAADKRGTAAVGVDEAAQGVETRDAWSHRSSPDDVKAPPTGGHLPGYGRLGAGVYTGADRIECRHEELCVGQICPGCGQGRFYGRAPGVEIRLDGNALLAAIRYELENLRCAACGALVTAERPEAAAAEKYSARARAVLAVGRYYLGVPFSRLAGDQAMLGGPMPDATPWDQIERLGDCGDGMFRYLERLAAQGELIFQDDTAVRILSLMDANQAVAAQAEARGVSRVTERSGMDTTALVVTVGARTSCWYDSGRAHAGENLASLLPARQANRDSPLVMADALSSTEADEASLLRCHCLAHGRRKCSDLEEVFPVECQVVCEALKQGCDQDEVARTQQMDAPGRLASHQQWSRPIMAGLKHGLDKQVADRLGAPNSALGKARASRQNHCETLSRFLQVPGAPLENTVAERALKLFMRQRKNALCHPTEHSAYIASVLTSLIATCLHAGVHAGDYLGALQEHRQEVFAAPGAWLPWT